MSRPQKETADFFYHSATASGEKILYILESEYGNDGYAFWFKLQEALCAEEGHCIEVSSGTTLRFLAARARVSLDAAERMLDLLAEIDAIDSDLWTKQRTIWSQSLIDGLTPLYMKRKSGMPTKPSLMISGDGVSVAEIPVSGAETPVNTDSRYGKTQKPGESGVSGGQNPQRRVEKSREEEKEIKNLRRTCRPTTRGSPPPDRQPRMHRRTQVLQNPPASRSRARSISWPSICTTAFSPSTPRPGSRICRAGRDISTR